MTFFGRTRFLVDGRWHVLTTRHRIERDEEAWVTPSGLLESALERLLDDPSTRLDVLRVFETGGGDAFTTRRSSDVASQLRQALETRELVLLREPLPPPPPPPSKAPRREPPPKPLAAKAPPRRIREKSFLDVTVVDADGTPLAGQPYDLQVPDGHRESDTLGAAGAIYRGDLDPGTALLKLLPRAGEPVPGEAPPVDPPVPFISLHVVDQAGDPLAGIRYEVTFADGTVAAGATDDAGAMFLSGIPAGACDLSLPDLADDAWQVQGA